MVLFLGGCRSSEKKVLEPLVINVLDKAMYDDCHIVGSIHVPFDQIEQYVWNEDRDREIVLYCSNYACTSSHYVAQKLRDRGFVNAKVYEGGMAEWWQNGLPTEGPAQKPYLAREVPPMAKERLVSISRDMAGKLVHENAVVESIYTVATISMSELAEKLHIVMVPKGNQEAAA
jgi:rhodanese-related sulfurtransferase